LQRKIVIIGAGPTGLGAAYRLQELGYRNWAIYEKNGYVGGLAASFKDKCGFTWDVGGHVMFSHYRYFDQLVERLLGDDYLEHVRESWIWLLGRWIPYPFQNNIKYLPKEAMIECLLGLIEVHKNGNAPAKNFQQWILNTFGKGIAQYFMLPYNFKVWATPPARMDKNWIADRVSVVDVERVLKNVIWDRDDKGWGPNSKFKFPLHGGTGALFNKFVPLVQKHLRLNKKLIQVDTETREIRFEDGEESDYDILINTSPLNELVENLTPGNGNLKKKAAHLKFNSGFVVGVGIKNKYPSSKCWIYFPKKDVPFYRVTYLSNYSPHNVPGEDYYSLLCETSYSDFKRESQEGIIEETLQGLIDSQMIVPGDRNSIVSQYLIDVKYSYPIPTLERDLALKTIQPFLEKKQIFSRGRFGAWKYEIGNMDHSVMMGKEIVDRILKGAREKIWSL
jgi:protoporphyrinogen oxidase